VQDALFDARNIHLERFPEKQQKPPPRGRGTVVRGFAALPPSGGQGFTGT